MTLRQKTLLIIGATLVALMIGLSAISSTVFLQGFAQIEPQDRQWNVRRAPTAFADEPADLNANAADRAVGRDSDSFSAARPENIVPPSIGAAAFRKLRLNLVSALLVVGLVFGLVTIGLREGQVLARQLSAFSGIVKQSGGEVSVASEPGCGTTFRSDRPRAAAPAASPPPPEKTGVAPRGTETILVVEDEPALREIASLVLTDLGYTVLTATNGREALELVQNRNGSPLDLLVTDVVMPQMGGQELASQLQTARPATKILFTSGSTEDAILGHGGGAANIAFLPKPYTALTLARTIREVLEP